MSSSDEIEKYLEWMQGDEDAARCISLLGQISQIADDFVDRDVERLSKDMTNMLLMALVELPENPFYKAYGHWLRPVMGSALIQWNASNDWAKGTDQQKVYAFVYRETLEILIPLMATLVGGREHGHKVALEVNSFYHGKETLEEWKKCL